MSEEALKMEPKKRLDANMPDWKGFLEEDK